MEKIFKKSLALLVSAALCLTAFVGCLTVNAEETTAPDATVTVGKPTAKVGEKQVTVPVTIQAAAGKEIAAAIFELQVDESKFWFNSNWDYSLTYTQDNIFVATKVDAGTNKITPVSANTYRFLVTGIQPGEGEDSLNTFTTAEFFLTFDIKDHNTGETAITYGETLSQACDAGTADLDGNFTGTDEQMLTLAGVSGSITISCDHNYSYVSDGETGHHQVCSACGDATETVVHTFDEGFVTQEPTEEATGIKIYTCTACKYVKEEVIEKLQHTHNYGEAWVSDETNHWHECTCGEKSELAAHDWGEGEVTKEPTATEPGIRTFTCVCGKTKTEDIPATGEVCEHTWEFVSADPATGSENSDNIEYTKGSITLKCADCGEEKTEVVNYSYYSRAQDSGLNYGSETLLRFGTRYNKDHPRIATNANITDGYIVLTQKRLGNIITTQHTKLKECEDTLNSYGHNIRQTKIGIVALAMSDDVTAVFYAYDATSNAWYSGYQTTYSVKTAAEDILSTSTNKPQKTALVNLLNYGAAAQEFFAKKPAYPELSNVVRANADIDAYQAEYATSPRAFDTVTLNYNYDGVLNSDQFSYFFYKSNLITESKTENRIYFRLPKYYTGASTAVDITGYTVEVTYTDFLGGSQTETYTYDKFLPAGTINRYCVDVPFQTPDLRAVANYVVKNENGVVIGPVASMSLANVCASIVNSSSDSIQINMINCLMAFSDAAYDYLTTK